MTKIWNVPTFYFCNTEFRAQSGVIIWKFGFELHTNYHITTIISTYVVAMEIESELIWGWEAGVSRYTFLTPFFHFLASTTLNELRTNCLEISVFCVPLTQRLKILPRKGPVFKMNCVVLVLKDCNLGTFRNRDIYYTKKTWIQIFTYVW